MRVADIDDENRSDCSDEFYLIESEQPPYFGQVGPYLMVTAPTDGDRAEVGEEYTVLFDYDNGVGSRVDRFKIDLYEADGNGDCGTWVTSICDKPRIGCKDSSE